MPAAARRDAEWLGRQWGGDVRDAIVAGRRIRYLGVGEGPVVLLVHGLGASWKAWYRTIPALVADHRVVALDLPGFGRSESLVGPTPLGRYVNAVVGLLDHLDVASALVVGHSLGGLIAQHLAVRSPERVAGLVLVATGDGRLDARQEAAFRGAAAFSRMARTWGPPVAVLGPAVYTVMGLAPLRRRLVARAVHDPSEVSRELATHMLISMYRSPALGTAIRAGLARTDRPDLSRVTAPTIVITGARDRLVDAGAARRLAADIPHAKHEIWPDVGHHPMLERADAFNARLRLFSKEMATWPNAG